MKKGLRAKLLAFALALCLCTTMVTPALAANGWRSNSGNRWSISNWWNNRWNHGNDNNTSNSDKSDSSSEPKLTLVEDQSTVAEGTNLRASTYAVDANSSDITADTDTVKYFPVTMYNYNQDTYNAALRSKETADAEAKSTTLEKWKGLYFGPQKSDATDTTTAGTQYAPATTITSGDTYYLVSYNTAVPNKLVSGTGLVALGSGTAGSNVVGSALANGTAWTITKSGNGNDNVYTIKNADGKYLAITKYGDKGAEIVDTETTVTIGEGTNNKTKVIGGEVEDKTYYLNAWGGATATKLGAYTDGKNDVGNNFYLYHKTNTAVTDALYYEDYNNWTGNLVKGTDNGANGNNTYSGLVNKDLDKSKNIQLNETDIGMFRSDDPNNTYGKTIYTGVGLPFEYDKDQKEYTFDSNTMSAHFTASNKAGSDKNMTYGSTPQTISDLDAQGKTDNSTTSNKNSWLPFNEGTSVATNDVDYYFGMQAAIPFKMTANGKLDGKDNSKDITFDFSGDDDVWVFVDGKLVLDLGGIHNELAGSMNFAENTWSITKGDGNITSETTKPVGDVNKAKMTGKLFNEGNETGALGTDRTTFAATTSHTLTVFYLERGAGASNCKIKFNLPVEDSVSVTKKISNTDSKGDTISNDSWTSLNNQTFTFKLFKDGEVLRNTNYIIVDESGNMTDTSTTTSDGTFTLKNNQTAKFVGQMSAGGNTYYVQEISKNGWETPRSTYIANAANGTKEVTAANGTTSAKVEMNGSDEAEDKLSYTFTNTLTHVDTTTVNTQDETIVLDYGLPVQIDALNNDTPLSGTGNTIEKMEIVGIRDANQSNSSFAKPTSDDNALQLTYGKAYVYDGEGTSQSRDSRIIYTPTSQATDLDKIEYQVKVTAKTSGGNEETAEGTATVTIIPATSMYYEENFSSMVKFTSGWTAEGTADTVYQEPGVVGTPNDSPYGSDNAYMNSNGDSNGTSMYTSTADGTAKAFKYTFTGTGTSFFARSWGNSGTMRVEITDQNGTVKKKLFRDTKYAAEGTLYNIPVFTWNADTYGTYTVTVTIAKKNTGTTYGTEFYLDGIRVMNPMNSASGSYQTAQDAYAADGESNMTVATLRDALLNDTTINENDELVWDTSKGFAVFTDSNDNITSASEYQSNGPKEEVYLANGQSVSFSLTNWDPNTNHLYLGIKAPMGSGTVRLGSSQPIPINNTVDCYYDVAKLVTVKEVDGQKVATLTITNTSDKIISLTNIKVTGAPDFVIIPPSGSNSDKDHVTP